MIYFNFSNCCQRRENKEMGIHFNGLYNLFTEEDAYKLQSYLLSFPQLFKPTKAHV